MSSNYNLLLLVSLIVQLQGSSVLFKQLELLVLLLPLHSPILKPNFDLSFGQTQSVRDFNASSSCQVSVEMEFLF